MLLRWVGEEFVGKHRRKRDRPKLDKMLTTGWQRRNAGKVAIRPRSSDADRVAVAMQEFLDRFAATITQDEHVALMLDQAGWHGSGALLNVTLVPLPTYSPELNPVERVWLYPKERFLSHRLLADYEAIADAACRAWNRLVTETGRITLLTSYPWILQVKYYKAWARPSRWQEGPHQRYLKGRADRACAGFEHEFRCRGHPEHVHALHRSYGRRIQHDEKLLPQMLEILRSNDADLVVGSRYISEGGLATGPGVVRL